MQVLVSLAAAKKTAAKPAKKGIHQLFHELSAKHHATKAAAHAKKAADLKAAGKTEAAKQHALHAKLHKSQAREHTQKAKEHAAKSKPAKLTSTKPAAPKKTIDHAALHSRHRELAKKYKKAGNVEKAQKHLDLANKHKRLHKQKTGETLRVRARKEPTEKASKAEQLT